MSVKNALAAMKSQAEAGEELSNLTLYQAALLAQERPEGNWKLLVIPENTQSVEVLIIAAVGEEARRIGALAFANDAPDAGATGNYPQGQLNDDDEGELQFAVANDGKNVLVRFGKPVASLGMDRKSALQFAESLTKHAMLCPEESEVKEAVH